MENYDALSTPLRPVVESRVLFHKKELAAQGFSPEQIKVNFENITPTSCRVEYDQYLLPIPPYTNKQGELELEDRRILTNPLRAEVVTLTGSLNSDGTIAYETKLNLY